MMSDLNISIDDVNDVIINDIIELGRAYYENGSYMLDHDYLNWFYLMNPKGTAKCVTAHFEQSLVGMMVLIPIKISNASDTSYFAANVLTHPQHRNKNIFVKLIRFTKSYFENSNSLLIGHPNSNAIPAWKRTKMLFREQMSPRVILPNIFKNNTVKFSDQYDMIKEFFSNKNNSKTVDKILSVDYDYEQFCWRYIRKPNNNYTINLVLESDVVVGIYVTKKYYAIVDLVIFQCFKDKNHNMGNSGSLFNFRPKVLFCNSQNLPMLLKGGISYPLSFLNKNVSYFITNFNDGDISNLPDCLSLDGSDF